VRQPDLVQGITSLAVIELPPPDDALADAPLLYAVATGADAGWRRAALFRYRAETASAEPLGGTAPAAVMGRALTALPPGDFWTIDMRTHVDLLLDNGADALLPADDDTLMRGANLCALGPELLQFGMAEPIGLGRYRLSRLLRGWRGTDWAVDAHEEDERFVLIDLDRSTRVPATSGDVGTPIDLRAIGTGDVTPAIATLLVDGRAIVPPSPVHGAVTMSGEGVLVRWTRRSRLGWLWRDGDVPLGEEREAYRVTVKAGVAVLREVEVSNGDWTYAAADYESDLSIAGVAPLSLQIRQIGTHGVSRALIIALD
jgi:hypothetical protein